MKSEIVIDSLNTLGKEVNKKKLNVARYIVARVLKKLLKWIELLGV